MDVTELIELKLNMLRCHKSQIPEDWDEEDTMVGQARLQSRTRGLEAGVKYAEAFRLVPQLAHARLSDLLT